MVKIYVEAPKKIIQNKKLIEKNLDINLSVKDKILEIKSKPEEEYLALNIVEALELGFDKEDALLLKDEKFDFKKINIKDFTRRKDLETIRARIIGTHGRTIETICSLTDCLIKLHGNAVGIIGLNENVSKAAFAVKRIIQGSRQANVYAYLEKQRALEKQMS